MEPMAPKQQDMIDVTDSLEAVDAARGMRFFLFWFVLFPALLILQILFWLNYAGRIESKDAPAESSVSFLQILMQSDAVALAAEIPAEQPPAEQPQPEQTRAEQPQPAEQPQQTPQAPEQPAVEPSEIEQGVKEVTGDKDDMAAVEPSPEEQSKSSFLETAKLSHVWARGIIRVCNFLILFAAVLYCLILLLCLKISLVGRLGGLFHITKAFLVSLLLVLVLFPWQVLVPRVMIGVLWLPGELFNGRWENINESIFWTILYFLRFTGLWLVAFVLLFWSRSRFVKWRSATLRRLGVLR